MHFREWYRSSRRSMFSGAAITLLLYETTRFELDTVKMLVEAYPQALTTAHNNAGITPILTLLSRDDMNFWYEFLNSIVKSEPLSTILASSLRIAGVNGWPVQTRE